MTYTVYILLSLKDNRYYIGQTHDVIKRLKMHNNGLVESTKHRRPMKLVYKEIFNSRFDAIKREKYIKKQKGGEGFKKIIKTLDAG